VVNLTSAQNWFFEFEFSIEKTLLIYQVFEHNTNHSNGDSAKITTHRTLQHEFHEKRLKFKPWPCNKLVSKQWIVQFHIMEWNSLLRIWP
jgi:hypothetical protein